MFKKILSLSVIFCFCLTSFTPYPLAYAVSALNIPSSYPLAHANSDLGLPTPGSMVHLSPKFVPAYLKGIVIHPENAFKFDFIIYKGDQPFSNAQKKQEYTKLIKYFLASLAVPDEDQWVNLSPYEKNRIIKDDLGKTEMGRDLLAQDYLLKQITASLIYPQDKLGQKFWDEIYNRAYKQYRTTNIPVNTFNKVWIVPDEADIYEKGNVAYLYKSHLKVMLEEDYQSLQKHMGSVKAGDNKTHTIGSQVVREVILPRLEKEVNQGKNFAPLRQVFSGMILAAWYKRTLKGSLLAKIYANKAEVKGVDQNPKNNEVIYQQYLKAFKKGVFNFIQEDIDRYTHEMMPKKYFSGGTALVPPDAAMGTDGEWKLSFLHHNPPGADREAIANLIEDGNTGGVELAQTTVDPAMTQPAVIENPEILSQAGLNLEAKMNLVPTGWKADILGSSVQVKTNEEAASIVSDSARLNNIFNLSEIHYAQSQIDPLSSFAARLAGKYAILKALGIQPNQANDEDLKDVQISNSPQGEPVVRINQSLRSKVGLNNEATILISLSHEGKQAAAFALVLKDKTDQKFRIGIDLIRIRRFSDEQLSPIVKLFAFTDKERQLAKDSDNPAQILAKIWTRKESIAKTLGGNLHATAFRDIDTSTEQMGISTALRQYFGIEEASFIDISESTPEYTISVSILHNGQPFNFGAISGAFKPEVNRAESTLESIREIARIRIPTDNRINDEPYQQLKQIRTINSHIDQLIFALQKRRITLRIVDTDPLKLQALQADQEDQGETDSLAAFEAAITSDLGFLMAMVDTNIYHHLLRDSSEGIPPEVLSDDTRGVLLINKELIQSLDSLSLTRVKVLEAELANALVQSENPYSSTLLRQGEDSLALQVAAILNELKVFIGIDEPTRLAISAQLPHISPHSPLDEGILQLARDFSGDVNLYNSVSGFTLTAIDQVIAFVKEHNPDFVQAEKTNQTVSKVQRYLQTAERYYQEVSSDKTRVVDPDYQRTPALRYRQRSHVVVSAQDINQVTRALGSKADTVVIDLNQAGEDDLKKVAALLNSQEVLNKFKSHSFFSPGVVLRLSNNWRKEIEQAVSPTISVLRGVQMHPQKPEDIYDVDAMLTGLELKNSSVGNVALWIQFNHEELNTFKNVDLYKIPRLAGLIGSQDIVPLAQGAHIPAIVSEFSAGSMGQGFEGGETMDLSEIDEFNSLFTPSTEQIHYVLQRAEAFLAASKTKTVISHARDAFRNDLNFLIFAERTGAIVPSSKERARLDLIRWQALYDNAVPYEVGVQEKSLSELLEKARAQYPQAQLEYITGYDQDEQGHLKPRKKIFTNAWINEQAIRLANSLIQQGVKKGDGVAILLPNSPQYEIAVQALGYIGAIETSPDIFYSPNQIEVRLFPFHVTTIITLDTMRGKMEEVMRSFHQLKNFFEQYAAADDKNQERLKTEIQKRIGPYGASFEDMREIISNSPGIQRAVVTSVDDLISDVSTVEETTIGEIPTFRFRDLLNEGLTVKPHIDLESSDIIKLQFTSGRGGTTKAAVHTQSSLSRLVATQGVISVPNAHEPTTILAPLVMSHTFGLAANLAGIMRGARRIMIPNVDPEEYLKTVFMTLIEEKVTEFFATPSSLKGLIAFMESRSDAKKEFEHLRAIHISGGKLSPTDEKRLNQILGREIILERLGMSEYPSFSYHPRDVSSPGNVGIPGPGARMRIVSLEDKEEVKKGEDLYPYQVGEIVIQGPSLATGYFKNPQASAEAFRDGWFHTGDMGYLDHDGLLHYVGVAKDVIKIRDFTVSPDEIENALKSIPGIKEAIVVPVKDQTGVTTGIRGVVVLEAGSKLTARRIQRLMQSLVSPMEVPSEIVGASHIAKTPGLGKLIRREWVPKALNRGSIEDLQSFDPKRTALLMPPAGYHFRGMGQDLYELDPVVKGHYITDSQWVTRLFAQDWVDPTVTSLAGREVHLDIISFSDPDALLSRVEKTQSGAWQWTGDFVASVMAMTEHQLNIIDLYQKRYGRPGVVAGESLGWPAALYASGALSRENALKLAFESAYTIKAASDKVKYQMAIVLGVSEPKLKKILTELNGSISVDESNQLVIVNVPRDRLKILDIEVKKAKGKMIVSNIPVASHTQALKTEATKEIWNRYGNYIRGELKSALMDPIIPIASTVEAGKLLTTVDEIITHDIASHFNPVLWRDAVKGLELNTSHINTFVQVGGPSAFTLEHQASHQIISEEARGLHLSRLGDLDLIDKPRSQTLVGQPITIDQLAVQAEAFASGDRNLFHLDDKFAYISPYKEKIAHGVLSQSYVMEFLGRLFPHWKVIDSNIPGFLAPVRFGDQIRPVVTIKTVEGQHMLVEYSALNQWGDILLTGTAVLKRHSTEADAHVYAASPTVDLKEKIQKLTNDIKPFELKSPENFQPGADISATYEMTLTQDVIDAYSYLFGNSNSNLGSIIGLGLMSFASSQFAQPPYVLTGARVFDFQEIIRFIADTLKTFSDKQALEDVLNKGDIHSLKDLLDALPFPKQKNRDRFRQKFNSSMEQAIKKILSDYQYRSMLIKLVQGDSMVWAKPQIGDKLTVKASLLEVKQLGEKAQKRQIFFNVEVTDPSGKIVYLGRITKQELDDIKVPEEVPELVLSPEQRELKQLTERIARTTQQAIFPADNRRMFEGAAEDLHVGTFVADHEDAMSEKKRLIERENTANVFNRMRQNTPVNKLVLINWLRSYRRYKEELQSQDRELINQLILDPDIETPKDFMDALIFDDEVRKAGWVKQMTPVIRETFITYLANTAHRRALVDSMDQIDTHEKIKVVRVNNGTTIYASGDLYYILMGMKNPPDAIFFPKGFSPDNFRIYDRYITAIEKKKGWKFGSVKIMFLDEYPQGIAMTDPIIASSPRIIMAEFGLVDYVAATRARSQYKQWVLQLFAKRRAVETARRHHIIAGDGITPALSVEQALQDALRSAMFGFNLKWNVNPRHGEAIKQVVFEPANLQLREHQGDAQFGEEPMSLEELKHMAEHNMPLYAPEKVIERRHIAFNRVGQYVDAGDIAAVQRALNSPHIENVYLTGPFSEIAWTSLQKIIALARAKGPKEIFVVVDGGIHTMKARIQDVYVHLPEVDAFLLSGSEYRTRNDVQEISDLLDDLERFKAPQKHATDLILSITTKEQADHIYYYNDSTKTTDGMSLVTRREKPTASRVTAVINQLPENETGPIFKETQVFYDQLRKDNQKDGFRNNLKQRLVTLAPNSQEAKWLGRQIDFDFYDPTGKEAPRSPGEAARFDQMGFILNAASAAGIDAIYDGRHVQNDQVKTDSTSVADMGYYGWIVNAETQAESAFDSMTLSRRWVQEALDVAETFHAALYRDKKGAVPYIFQAGLDNPVSGLDDEATSKIFRGSFEPEERVRARGILERALELGLLNEAEVTRYHMYALPQLWQNGDPVIFSTKRWRTLWEFVPGSNFKRLRHQENSSITAHLDEATQKWVMDKDVFEQVIEHTAKITFERPDASNTMSQGTWEQLEQTLSHALGREDVHAIVINGNYDIFSGGDDLKNPPRPDQIAKVIRLITESKKPVVIAVDGQVSGSALSLVLAAHKRIATSKVTFDFKQGQMPSQDLLYQLPRLLGIEEGIEFLSGKRTINKEGADTFGLVDEIVPDPAPRTPKLPIDIVTQRALEIASGLAAGKSVREERKWDAIEFRQTEESLDVFGLHPVSEAKAAHNIEALVGETYAHSNRDIARMVSFIPPFKLTLTESLVKLWVKANDTGMEPFFTEKIVPGPVIVGPLLSYLFNYLPGAVRLSHTIKFFTSFIQGESVTFGTPEIVGQDGQKIKLIINVFLKRDGQDIKGAKISIWVRPKTKEERALVSSLYQEAQALGDVTQTMLAWGEDARQLEEPIAIPKPDVNVHAEVSQRITPELLKAAVVQAGLSAAIPDVIAGNIIAKAITKLLPKGYAGASLTNGELEASFQFGDLLTATITVIENTINSSRRRAYHLNIVVTNQDGRTVMQGVSIMFSRDQTSPATDHAQASVVPGGIDLNSALLTLHIKRDTHGVPLSVQFQDIPNIHINGLIPVIMNIVPVTNMSSLLGVPDGK